MEQPMTREELKKKLCEACNHQCLLRSETCDDRCAFYVPIGELLAEFDRLKVENERLVESNSVLGESLSRTLVREKSLQSWLDRICEGWKGYHCHDPYFIRDVVGMHRKHGNPDTATSLAAIADYLDSQKESEPVIDCSCDCPICNPPKCEHKAEWLEKEHLIEKYFPE